MQHPRPAFLPQAQQLATGVRPPLALPPGSIAIANATAPLLTPGAAGHAGQVAAGGGALADARAAQHAYHARVLAGAAGAGANGVTGNGAAAGAGAGGRRDSGGLGLPPQVFAAGGVSPGQLSMPVQGSSPAPLPPPAVNQNGKRALSPERVPSVPPSKTMRVDGQANGAVYRAPSPDRRPASPEKPQARGTGIDLRAEEEAARRANLSRPAYHGPSRSKQTDLLPDTLVRDRLARAVRAAGLALAVDDDAARYLALAAEARVRALLAAAVRAHDHRVGSGHARAPPLVYKDDARRFKDKARAGAGEAAADGAASAPPAPGRDPAGKAKPLWAHQVRADPAAVLAKLGERAREDNKAHRVARSERNAREFELAKQLAAAAEREGRAPGTGGSAGASAEIGRARDGSSVPDDAASPSAAGGGGSASTPGADAAGEATPSKAAKEITFSAAPTFGAAPAPRKPKGSGKKRSDVSAEAQAKMTNVVASSFTGRKRYGWEMGGGAFAPSVPSLLSGKRKKADGADDDGGGAASSPAAPSPGPSGDGGGGPGGQGAAVPALPVPPARERRRRPATLPARYDVAVDGGRRARDDAALTRADVVFALERARGPRGWGGADDVVDRVWARWGGPYA